MVGPTQLSQGINQLNLAGATVCLHCSLRSFGWLNGGAATLLDAFLAADCTVLVPTFSDQFRTAPPADLRPANNGWNYCSDLVTDSGSDELLTTHSLQITREEMGALPYELLH